MSRLQIKKAEKSKQKLRLALCGVTGSGKTYSALRIAAGMGKRICVIDTERQSASLYADEFSFKTIDMPDHNPETYIEALDLAAQQSFDVVIVDSLSHAWMGREGALEQVDRIAKRSQSGNSFAAWRDVTPLHHKLVDALLTMPCHLIATMRLKMAYELQRNDKGKVQPVKLGLQPVQREGVEYEFTIVGDLSLDHALMITKTRWREIDNAVIEKPGQELGQRLLEWVDTGADMQPNTATAPIKPATPTRAQAATARMVELAKEPPAGLGADRCREIAKGMPRRKTEDKEAIVIALEKAFAEESSPSAPQPPPRGNDIAKLWSVVEKLEYSDMDVADDLRELYGKTDPTELTEEELHECLSRYQATLEFNRRSASEEQPPLPEDPSLPFAEEA